MSVGQGGMGRGGEHLLPHGRSIRCQMSAVSLLVWFRAVSLLVVLAQLLSNLGCQAGSVRCPLALGKFFFSFNGPDLAPVACN